MAKSPAKTKTSKPPKTAAPKPPKPPKAPKAPKAIKRADAEQPQPAKAKKHAEFSPELADEICERIASGETLISICKEAGKPADRTVRYWVQANPEFARAYALAREQQLEYWADLIVEESATAPTT